ncbi:hypothetical protein [Bacillus sp. SJS]|uniref:hypothetical protein n=1 Tax=Bacillus sp. SJS TaxID=1423321 RepID=UPI000551F9AE|nr:hypothetical protein [Bacillus sp. SJS]
MKKRNTKGYYAALFLLILMLTGCTSEGKSEPSTETSGKIKSVVVGPLSSYSSKEIEYARVWLQLGPNQDLDELNVHLLPAGTPLNSDDSTSAAYPEDVIQLAGSRLADGSVTYSGNGNGTINVYNIPLRWDGQYPAGKKFYEEIINTTKLVSIDKGSPDKIVKLINKMKIVEGF